MRLVFDIETDGLLDDLTKIHSIVIHDLDNNKLHSFDPTGIDEAVNMLEKADVIIGHNVIGFDIPAIVKVYPQFSIPPYVDTLICSRLIWSDIKENDFKFKHKSDFPLRLIGKHSLESWGYRLGLLKAITQIQMTSPRGLLQCKSIVKET